MTPTNVVVGVARGSSEQRSASVLGLGTSDARVHRRIAGRVDRGSCAGHEPLRVAVARSGLTFVGRERERVLLRRALRAGQGIVLRGRYGIGRTELVRTVAGELGSTWLFLFVDSRQTPASICAQLAAKFLVPPRRRSQTPATYRGMRSWLSKGRWMPGTPVLVLDDIERLTTSKWELLRFLNGLPRLRIIAVVESFLSGHDATRLRAVLYPSIGMELHHLRVEESVKFFSDASDLYGLGWSDEHLQLLATSRGGYPLEMAIGVARAREERKAAMSPRPRR